MGGKRCWTTSDADVIYLQSADVRKRGLSTSLSAIQIGTGWRSFRMNFI